METIHAHDSPLAAYLEGEGTLQPDFEDHHHDNNHHHPSSTSTLDPDSNSNHTEPFHHHPFAPSARASAPLRPRVPHLQIAPPSRPPTNGSLTRAHHAWSTAVNSRLGASDNAKFLEHFRYTIVASQLLNEYLDHGSLDPVAATSTILGSDGASTEAERAKHTADLVGALSAAGIAFVLVYLIDWARTRRVSKSRAALALSALAMAAFVGYGYLRRQWLQSLRRQAVDAATGLTTNWQALELSSSSALSFIQEVELVSRGYRLSTPLPPVSRVEEGEGSRRCAKLRRAVYKAYSWTIPACIEASAAIRPLIDELDLDKYFEVYDISPQDAAEACGPGALGVLEDDPESLKSLRVLSYRAGILRRVTLSSLMALEADGGKPDFSRWNTATEAMSRLSKTIAKSTERVRQVLSEMESFNLPSPAMKSTHAPNRDSREKIRGQVRKISHLATGIRGLQAKMQILREETNNSIEQSEDLNDLGPTLMAQYEAIGADLRELLQAWEAGKQTLLHNITRHERRISMASSGLRSPVSSIGGLTAVDELVAEGGGPADALKVLDGDGSRSNRSSLNTTPSDEEMVFEAVAMPRPRASTSTREERVMKMQEDRMRQAEMRAKRDANTNMLRELESVIYLRPRKLINGRVTSL